MKSEELFRMLEDIDDAYILEAKEDEPRRMPWKIIGTAAAIAVVAIGTVWFSARLLNRPEGPQELAAPTISTEPGTSDHTAAPDVSTRPDAPDVSTQPTAEPTTPVPVATDRPDQTPPSANPTPYPPDITGESGTGAPGPVTPESPVQPSPQMVRFETPTLPGFADIDWPEDGPHEPPLYAEYIHNDEGDFIVFTCPVPEMNLEPLVFDITGQIEDGFFNAFILDLFDQPQRLFVLAVNDDGTYEIYWDHDPYNDTEWWLESEP